MSERTRSEHDKVVTLDFGIRQPTVRIHLLGAMRALSYLGESILPRGRKTRAVLGYLCLNAGQRIPRSRIASLLWDRVPDQQARTNLRQALRELTVSMGSLADELITADLETVKLEARLCWIDALAILSTEPLPGQSSRGDLASLCVGELLEDLSGVTPAFDQWLLTERTRFTSQLRLQLENELQQICQSQNDPERHAALARRVIAFDATHEGASRILMRALADMGERAQAIREYERCRVAIKTALDVEPSPETRALYQAIKAFSGTVKADEKELKPVESAKFFEISSAPTGLTTPSLLPSRLRVGVLPFHGGPSASTESLAFTISQEIADALARFRWFDVIAPVSIPRGSASIGVGHAARRKQWHYIVDGTLTGHENKVQISVRLLDVGQEARPVWSDRFELRSDALDQLHDRVVAPVVARIDPVILFIEGQHKRPQRFGATGLVLQALPLMYSLGREKYEEAGRLIDQALETDPDNIKAATWGAYWHVWHVGQGWSKNPVQSCAKAHELALHAIRLDPENAEALGVYGHICAFLEKDFDSATHYFERALRLNPNLAFIWALSAPTYCYIGQPERALRHLNRYRDLAPLDPYFHLWESLYTTAYAFKGDYEEAVKVGRRAVRANSEFSNGYKPLIAALGHLGRCEEAAPYIEKLLFLEPNFTVERFGKIYPFQREEDRERYMRGLALAGVPLA
jgi:DNA-binding SARP family transcriptional activator/TolB-like protein